MSQADCLLLLCKHGGPATVRQLAALAVSEKTHRDEGNARKNLYLGLVQLERWGVVKRRGTTRPFQWELA